MMIDSFLLIKLLWFDILPKNISLEEVRNLSCSIGGMITCPYAEYLVQLLKGLAFCLRHEEKDPEESDNIPDCIPGECSLRLKCLQQTWPSHTQYEIEALSRLVWALIKW